ncbi:DUF3696 domain-containing protein [Kluyvera ascorbata]|uniref:DUF3696 domain-containing protein n=1 Tax=Kluyvera ascorbata TaxID=51288 RepID=UPI002ABB1EEB|nr:DUF3696 domain-containing protein [Kluyvera ascorbata]MDZ4034403.1 DUF3696 domain-containing protein [Kluyvera ascorbata]
MINSIYVKNFKCFLEQTFTLAPLTIFCGSNSAGKSTAIQSILSVKQNIDTLSNRTFQMGGELFNFGKLKDLLSHNPSDNEIIIGINNSRIKLIAEQLSNKECYLNEENITALNDITFLNQNDFVYLCAERFGPRSSFDMGKNNARLDVGIYGQFALSTFFFNQSKPANNPIFARMICKHLLEKDNQDNAIVFTDALVREAMRIICPGFTMQVLEAEEIDRVYNLYMSGSESVRPINVGFGISYLLPLIISASVIKPGGILVVENPEVHLHPAAQSELIKILCALSKTGVQVIIETHSDHIINGVRVYAKDNEFSESDNVIYSLTEHKGSRSVKEIHIDEDGNLTALDDGFFDQITKDLMRLF